MASTPDRPQTYDNHRSFPRALYLGAGIVILAETCWRGYVAATEFTGRNVWAAVVALALLVAWHYARRSAQVVQDRVIRYEMRARLERLLGAGRREAIERIELRDLIALRFASDRELPGLVARVEQGEFAGPDAIKRAVTSWQADWLRV